LLTHRSELTYGDFHRGPIRHACAETLDAQIDNPLAPDEWIARVAMLPLIDQPGAGFHYGISTDLLGFLIARLDGALLGEVLARRIFLSHNMLELSQMAQGIGLGVWSAIASFHAIATS
jgi:CubicO group peptidase (beta-lactamase class C family)